ncbi:MAG: hypothetical protein IPK80_29625 [Nannocystis sp.]|nr:hypothetical protein [Nannocystis sp.]
MTSEEEREDARYLKDPSGMATVGRLVRWQLLALALYLVPAVVLLASGVPGYSVKNPPEWLVVIGFFGPMIQAGLSLVIGLVMMIATRRKNVGAGLMLGGVVVGMIGVTTCLGLVFAAY